MSDSELSALSQIVPLNHVESNTSVSSDMSLLELCANTNIIKDLRDENETITQIFSLSFWIQ